MKGSWVRDIVWLFTITRLLLIMITYFSYILLTAPKYSNTPVDIPALLSTWNHWDAANYVRIAQYGYQSKFDLAFFPLFPLLISAFSFPNVGWSYLAVGTLLSNAALLGAMLIIYQLVRETEDEQVAYRTILYLCIFPTAFYFFAAYNESLFLLLTAGTFLALQRRKWWWAGLCGLLAALTRSAAILLVIPYLYELWQTRESSDLLSWRKRLPELFPVVLIPLGTALYSLYCWYTTGDPIAFATVQDHWARHLSWPWQGIWQALFELFWNQPFGSFNQAHALLDLSATLAFLALAILGRSRLRTSYTLWMGFLLLYILISPSTGQHDPLISNQRFVLELFPGFIMLAILGIRHPRLHQTLLLIFQALLATLSILFIMNRWMV